MIYVWSEANPGVVSSLVRGSLGDGYRVIRNLDQHDLTSKDVVLAMGTLPAKAIQEAGLAPKNLSLTKLRGKQLADGGPSFLCTYAPGIVKREWDKRGAIQWDARLARRLHDTGTLRPSSIGKYRYAQDLGRFVDYCKRKADDTGKPVKVVTDLETIGFAPWYHTRHIVTSQWTAIAKTALVVNHHVNQGLLTEVLRPQIEWLLSAPEVLIRGANLKFDLVWIMEKWGIECTNFTFDTLLAGSLLDENRNNSLNWHAKAYTTMGGYDDEFEATVDKSRMDLALERNAQEFLVYAGGDVDACLRAGTQIQKALRQNPKLEKFYRVILHPAARVFEKIERRGLLVDVDKLESLGANELTEAIRENTSSTLAKIPKRLRCKYIDDLKPTRAALLVDYLFDDRDGLRLTPEVWAGKKKYGAKHPKAGQDFPSVSIKDHLSRFAAHEVAGPFISDLKALNSAEKTLSTYVEGFLKHARPDGRFHPTYALHNGALFDKGGEQDDAGTVCVVGDTRLLTNRGWVRMDRVQVGDEVLTHTGTPSRVMALVDNGVKDTLTVTLSNGSMVTCTENHKFYTGSSWVRADHLVAGQELSGLAGEDWKPIPGWSRYEISSWGRVRNVAGDNKRGDGFLSPHPKGQWGHHKVTLSRGNRERGDGNRRDVAVHRLVAEAFVPNPDHMPEVRHLDGCAWNNVSQNLAWGSSLDNRQDAVNHGTMSKVNHHQAKLTWKKVDWIRSRYAEGNVSQQELANRLGVSRELVRDVLLGKRWVRRAVRDVSFPFTPTSVVSVEKSGKRHTYDATVEGAHSYVANGVVTHNTGRLSARDPAIQTVPKHTKWAKPLRRCFPAPNGMLFWEADFCVDGSTRILGADLKHHHARDLKMGDELVGFDEEAQGRYGKRKLRKSVVEWMTTRECPSRVKLTFEDGTSVTTSEDHRWLAYYGTTKDRARGGVARWTRSGDLKPGNRIKQICNVWDTKESYDAGKMTGLLEGEGWLSLPQTRGGYTLGFGQNPGLVLEEYQRLTRDLFPHLEFRTKRQSKTSTGKVWRVWNNRISEIMEVIGSLRPCREWLDREFWDGVGVPRVIDPKRIAKVEKIGAGEVVSIRTSTGTYVAEGLASHNCQGELRVAACLADETNMIQLYRDGYDLHAGTGAKLAGVDVAEFLLWEPEDHVNHALFKRYRQRAKAGNFGLLYRMSARGFQSYALINYGVALTMREAEEFVRDFFDMYPGLLTWHKKQVSFARKYKYVISPLGRVRHLPLIDTSDGEKRSAAERHAINSPVQSCLSDLNIWAAVQVETKLGGDDSALSVNGATHDCLYGYVRERGHEELLAEVAYLMSNLPIRSTFGWKHQIPFPAEAEVGENWADMHKVPA